MVLRYAKPGNIIPPGGEEWMWSMLLTHRGPAFRPPTNGRTSTRGQAVLEMLECWWASKDRYAIKD